ncbi:MAG: hypothetical protein P4M01_14600 [Acidobacteriota bacterium]|nr:hypothetical protein [Acidobacteriota bacterium]
MNCNEFDVLIDEMLSGILHPEASLHMRQCERCTSHWHARQQVQSCLGYLAAAAPQGPSAATDRAVMEAFRRFQQNRQGGAAASAGVARVLSFPGQRRAVWGSRTLWSGAAAAALLFAVLGSSVRLWHNTPVVTGPVARSAPRGLNGTSAVNAASLSPMPSPAVRQMAGNTMRRVAHRVADAAGAAEQMMQQPAPSALAASRTPGTRTPGTLGTGRSYDFAAVKDAPAASAPVHLASVQERAVQSSSYTWPGYSNLMYCDPVACSGPMQVVHIKVPVGEVKPNVGQSVGNTFVNADVVVGADGVARAIRVAN